MPTRRAEPVDPATGMMPIDSLQGADRIAGNWLPIVGVGASAGGLDPLKMLLAALPSDTGMAFVLIQHLNPLDDSLMADLLSGHTKMPVTPAAEGVLLKPNHVYLIPPRGFLAVSQGRLRLSEPPARHGARMPFDFFLQSLAEDCGERAIGVVLSGSGKDGSEGLRSLKSKGGFVIVQETSEAAYDGMPNSAILTGEADLVLPVARIPGALMEHAANVHRQFAHAKVGDIESEIHFVEVLDLLKRKTHQDFSLYKTGTLRRRIERRMEMAGLSGLTQYAARLKFDPRELDNLRHDVLINVTEFFRDAAAFDALSANVIPAMVEKQPIERPLRIWAPGCSTGEEVYSLAILFMEAIQASGRTIKLQVFASDVDPHSVAFARAGVYGPETAANVSVERLAKFFSRHGDGFCVVRELRDAVVFTVQDLLSDPPFSRVDLISCRNVLIYLQPAAQEQILGLFHFALSAGGVLFLGRSETLGRFLEHFEPIDKKQRIYRHLSAGRAAEADFSGIAETKFRPSPASGHTARKAVHHVNLADLASKLLAQAFAPPSVLVDKKYEALYYSGGVDKFLQLAPGEANRNILVMAREGLRPKLREALEAAQQNAGTNARTSARFRRDGETLRVTIGVQKALDDIFLVSFVEESGPIALTADLKAPPEDASRVAQLEQELIATHSQLNFVIRDLEISNEDLRVANEEALSINEELQSTNEELETSKEELQSLNEELTALNAQLQDTLEQQRATAADLQNILNSSGVATLFLDPAFNIRFFTPAAKSLFRVSSVDIGRPVSDLAQRFHDDALLADARAVLTRFTPVEREIESHDGNWYIRTIHPYRVAEGEMQGVVITFARISEMKAAERKTKAARAYAESIIATVRQPLVVFDQNLRIVSASASFLTVFRVSPERIIGKPFTFGLENQQRALANFIEAVNAGGTTEECELELDLAVGKRTFLLCARRIAAGFWGNPKILLSFDDVTGAKMKAEALAAAKDEAERANLGKSRFLAAASHDLRQPLQTLSLLQGMLADSISDEAGAQLIKRLDKTIDTMAGVLDELLDINQLEAGVVKPRPVVFAINEVLHQLRIEFEIQTANAGLNLRVVPCNIKVRTDPRLLEHILRNMLSNATKYTNRGKILFGCRRRGDRLSIEVWDTGTGIPETELSTIFKEFHQLENHPNKRTRGLGLGLAIVQRLGDLMEAPITVRSRLGQGSAFAVEVPVSNKTVSLAAPEKIKEPQGAASVVNPKANGQQLILIIEDDAEIRDTLTMLFNGRGYTTLAARDGLEALAIASELHTGVDLIVADYNLPGASGLEVVARMRKTSGRQIPSILLTGDISANTLREIAEQDFVHFYKPTNAQKLMHQVNIILDKGGDSAADPTIFIIDDDAEIRKSLRDMLKLYGYRTESFASASSFLDSYSPDRRGCVITDARMPGVGGMQLIERLHEIQPQLRIIMLTAYSDVAMAVNAMKAGAFDFLQKPADRRELLDSIDRALNYSPDYAEQNAVENATADKIKSLTDRQRQILNMVLTGSPSKNIAADLKISQRTVDNHRAAIMKKTGAKSLSELIKIALTGGHMDKPVVASAPHKQIPYLSGTCVSRS